MLYFSLKQTIPIAKNRHSLHRTIKTASVQRQQRAKFTTTAAASTTKQQKEPIVVSRRAWLEFKESQGITKRRPDPSKRPKSDDEKPWPRNVQIAGYVASVLAVPYMVLWTVTSNPSLREWCGPYIPLDKLRTHFGKLEWDAQSYSEEMEGIEIQEKTGKDESQSLIKFYQFPEEPPFHERRQQEVTGAMSESDLNVRLSLFSLSSSVPEEIVTKKIAARTVANTKDLLEHFPSTTSSTRGNMTVAIDFLDESDDVNTTDNLDTTRSFNVADVTTDLPSDGILMTGADSVENIKIGRERDGSQDISLRSQKLMTETQTMSKWSYIPEAAGEGLKNGTNKSSGVAKSSHLTEVDMEISRLKYEISELEKSLRDPMCTRNIDDMTSELRQAKRNLSRLTWKKWFRLA